MIELSLAGYEQASESQQRHTASLLHKAFTEQHPLIIRDYVCHGIGEEQVQQNLLLVREALKKLEVDLGFVGIDGRQVKRRSCAVINAFDRPEVDDAYITSQMAVCDGDPESLSKGLAMLRQSPELRRAINQNNLVMNHVIHVVMDVLRLNLRIPPAYFQQQVLTGSTYRQRLVYYDATIDDSQCGVHPDGNLLSFLITDSKGYRYFDADFELHEPAPDGILCAAGSLLWRWSGGLYPPLFHDVKQMSGHSKTSIVYFYNLENNKTFHAVPFGERHEPYVNDIKKYKPEDVSRDGPFGDRFDILTRRASYE